ncbi:MAG: cupin-like domain-containing protein [Myxococcota bacterium]
MTILDNIERISEPGPDDFARDYIPARKPVIITDLFRDQPLRQMTTAEDARGALGDMELTSQWNYTAGLRYEVSDDDTEPLQCSVADYLDYVDLNPDTPRMCIEQLAPAELRQTYTVPELCRGTERSFVFMGNAGNYAHLHFDGDQRQVLMYQIFGRKRVVLIAPEQSKKLMPNENFSSLCLQEMADSDRRDLLRYVRAYECVLEPGEAIFMPSLFWHYLEYVETSMSLHLRFAQNRYGQFFDTHVHRDMYTQNVAARFVDERFAAGEGGPVLTSIQDTLAGDYDSAEARYRAIRTLFRDLYRRLCPDAVQGTYAVARWTPGEEVSGIDFYADADSRHADMERFARGERAAQDDRASE